MTFSALQTLVSFVGIGIAGAAAYVILATVLAVMGLAPWLASMLSYGALIPLVYIGQRTLTFRSEVAHRSSFPKYIASQVLGLGLSVTLPYLVANRLPPVVAFATVALTIAVTNFFLLKWWAFRPSTNLADACGSQEPVMAILARRFIHDQGERHATRSQSLPKKHHEVGGPPCKTHPLEHKALRFERRTKGNQVGAP